MNRADAQILLIRNRLYSYGLTEEQVERELAKEENDNLFTDTYVDEAENDYEQDPEDYLDYEDEDVARSEGGN